MEFKPKPAQPGPQAPLPSPTLPATQAPEPAAARLPPLQVNPAMRRWSKEFMGNIGKHPVQFRVTFDGQQVTGTYQYQGKRQSLNLSSSRATPMPDGTLTMQLAESDGQQVTGHLTLTLSGETLAGTWQGAGQAGKTLKVNAQAASAPSPDAKPTGKQPQATPPIPALPLNHQPASAAPEVAPAAPQTGKQPHSGSERPHAPSGNGVIVTTGTDRDILAAEAIPLKGLKGKEKTMARVYNARAGYFAQVSEQTGIEAAVIAAVMVTESGSAAYNTDFESLMNRQMTIRFENHKFHKFWGAAHQEQFDQHYQFGIKNKKGKKTKTYLGHKWRPDDKTPWQSPHASQDEEWRALDFSRTLDDTAALQSISMGMGQLMGFNHKDLGYPTVQAMFADMQQGARPQLDGMLTFMTKNAKKSLKERDFVAFARVYNGSGQAATYGALIQKNYDAYVAVTSRFKK